MDQTGFRKWLSDRGLGANSASTRTSAVSRIEKVLPELRFAAADLDAEFKRDGLVAVRAALKDLKADAANGGQAYRVLLPDSESPETRLPNFISWLGNYRAFLAGEAPLGDTDAEQVRQHVLDHYIAPARERGDPEVLVNVRAVHDALGQQPGWANICQALAGPMLQDLASVGPPRRDRDETGPHTNFTFDLVEGAMSLEAAQLELERRFGSPIKSNVKLLAYETADGRQLAMDRGTKVPQVWVEADRPLPTGLDTKAYEASQSRHSNLPPRLDHSRPDSLPVALVRLSSFSDLRRLLDWYKGATRPELNSAKLEQYRQAFLARYPDFEPEGFAARSGSYFNDERAYKDRLIALAATAVQDLEGKDDAVLGARLLDILTGQAGAPSGLLGWRTDGHIKAIRAAHPGLLEREAGQLARAPDVGDAIEMFVQGVWPALEEGQKSRPYAESRNIPTMTAALLRPEEAFGINTTPLLDTARALLGRSLFGEEPLAADQYAEVLAFVEMLRSVMTDEWHWAPRDLWDVQGFIWAVNRTDKVVVPPPRGIEPMANPADPTNLILFGPPGTGKTFATAAEAVRLCLGEAAAEPLIAPGNRTALMSEYQRLCDEGRIEFVTFHQSYAYEDFVEGLRPTTDPADALPDEDDSALDTPRSGGFRLQCRPGIFKRICEKARLDRGEEGEGRGGLDRKKRVFKIALGQRDVEEDRIAEGLDDGLIHLGWGGDIDWSDERFDDFEEIRREWREQKDPNASGKNPNIEMTWSFRAVMQVGDYVVLSDGRDLFRAFGRVTGEYYYDEDAPYHPHRRKVEWLWKSPEGVDRARFYKSLFRRQSVYELRPATIEWDALEAIVLPSVAAVPAAARPFVLVIDEINRANISKVFGELITLLEPDKRLGMPNELRVRLPYSDHNEPRFGVPANLHIIGTMNTADRSIALLDTALRRRFEFVELMPEPETLAQASNDTGIDLVGVLNGLNARIEYLFDREHQIGHAFFIGCRTEGDVDRTMRSKVIPLLTEYFYENWEKVRQVLGETEDDGAFVSRTRLVPFKGADAYQSDEGRWRYSVNRTAFVPADYEQLKA